ncbi:MAG: glycosyltransferase family 4 protein [Siculibacillus sp.]|nr:glycosyltransferase family 4 protein [Siculibacillus sp.]
MNIVCNVRVLDAAMTGIQRYTHEILRRMPTVAHVRPARPAAGARGHLWEQLILPTRLGGRLLWSPSNTGPIAIRRQVVTVHDLATFDIPSGFSRSFRTTYAAILPLLLPRVEAILTVSHFTRDRLMDRFDLPADRIHVTHLAVDHDRFRLREPAEVEAFRTAHGLPARFALFVGAMSGRKNVAGLLSAWQAALGEIDPDVELIIAGGSGPSRVLEGTRLERLPPRTRLIGHVADEDLPLLYAAASLFTYPSLYEGFGLPVLEAMASGTPVLTSSTTSLPEVAGDAAVLIDPHDLDDIAAGLVAFFAGRTSASDLRAAGLRRAAEFRWERTAEATRAVLERHAGP